MITSNFRVNLFKFALFLTTILFLLHLTISHVRVFGWPTSIFYLDETVSLGAYFSQVVLFATFFMSIILFFKDRFTQKSAIAFIGLFALGLSLDEYLEVHGYLREVAVDLIDADSSLYVAFQMSWVVPLSILILLVIAGFVFFAMKKEIHFVRSNISIVIVAMVLVVLLEFVGGQTFGSSIYVVFVGVEEFLEMVIAVFLLNIILKFSTYSFPESNVQTV